MLVGLLSLAIALVKQQDKSISSINNNSVLFAYINELYSYLFSLHNTESYKIQLPKLRSNASRSFGFELLLEFGKISTDCYSHLHSKLFASKANNDDSQEMRHFNAALNQIVCDYWPKDEAKSPCGYVGLVNLGATCYMATAMQHLFMIDEARQCILSTSQVSSSDQVIESSSKRTTTPSASNEAMLAELRKMYAFLQQTERKAYNPRDLCNVYIMDQQPLNTSEQKDMQEFFTDLIGKLDETQHSMLKSVIKRLFAGTITNLVMSLDCEHVSCVLEPFFTVRCQVAGMRDLTDALNEITVKDTLEGDNMYTCSKCGRKVRAEKRACFRQLPQILCFNTMRYTFNMVTMLKEKVNTHFSFPMRLNMSGYMEKNLIGNGGSSSSTPASSVSVQLNGNEPPSVVANGDEKDESFIYDLIGVTVHTGTAEGGHYYSFIKVCMSIKIICFHDKCLGSFKTLI